MLALEPLLQKLAHLRYIPFELGVRRAVSAYVDDIIIMVPDVSVVEMIDSILE